MSAFPNRHPSWLCEKVQTYDAVPPRYESSWHGVWTFLLTAALPGHEGFEVKPQSRLRPEVNLEISMGVWLEIEQERTSFDSYDLQVQLGGAGHTRQTHVPDFVVSYHGGSYEYVALVVEIKAGPLRRALLEDSRLQLEAYLRAALPRTRHGVAYGMLAEGSRVGLYVVVEGSDGMRRLADGIGVLDGAVYSFMRDAASSVSRRPGRAPELQGGSQALTREELDELLNPDFLRRW